MDDCKEDRAAQEDVAHYTGGGVLGEFVCLEWSGEYLTPTHMMSLRVESKWREL